MQNITEFRNIGDFLTHANLRVEQKMDDFLIYSYDEVNQDASVEMRSFRHHYFEITLDINQGCSFQVDDFKFPLKGRRICMISPRRLQSNIVHQEIHPENKGFTILFKEDFLSRHLNTTRLRKDYPFLQSVHSPVIDLNEQSLLEFHQLFELIRYEFQQYGQQSREILRSYLTVLLEKGKKNYKIAPPEIQPERRAFEIAARFEKLCQEKITRFQTVAEYADLLKLTPKHLTESVKQVTGKSALEIINTYRVGMAKSLLCQTQLSAKEVAYELGFENPDYFFTFFKKQTGLTPTEFRQI